MIRVGEAAWLLELGSSARVLAAHEALASANEPSLADVVPGATTLLVVLRDDDASGDAHRVAEAHRVAALATAAAARGASAAPPRVHDIPVRYDGDDLARVAAHAGCAPHDVAARHAAAAYRVAFVGFQPGFAYLSGLPDELHVPRHPTPRPRVPPGSVAIGGEWTGVYPLATPGGWNLIGTADVSLFAPQKESPALLQPGDGVRFVPR